MSLKSREGEKQIGRGGDHGANMGIGAKSLFFFQAAAVPVAFVSSQTCTPITLVWSRPYLLPFVLSVLYLNFPRFSI